jgi:putative inorganic carbon (hco3(-)) transporter
MRDIVLTIIVLGSLPLCFLRPWIGILMWSWLGFMNPHKLAWGFAHEMPFALLVAIALLAGLLFSKDRKPIPWEREMLIIAAFLGIFTITSFLAWEPHYAWAKWSKVSKVLLMTLVTTMLIYGQKRIQAFVVVIALSIGFYGAKGGVFTLTSGGASHVLGPEGTFIGGNTEIGLAMIMVLPLLVLLARHQTRPWLRILLYLVCLLTVIATVFTYSRGALIGLAAVLPLLFFKFRNKVWVVLLLVPLAYFAKDLVPEKLYARAGTIQTYQEDYSAMQRLQAWSVALNVAIANPLTGAGFEFEYYPDEQRWLAYADRKYDAYGQKSRAAHSIYFQVLGNHGFVAFGLFVALLVFTWLRLARLKREFETSSDTKWIADYASTLQISLVGYLVAGSFLSQAYFDLFYAIVALAVILGREAREHEQPIRQIAGKERSFGTVVSLPQPGNATRIRGRLATPRPE